MKAICLSFSKPPVPSAQYRVHIYIHAHTLHSVGLAEAASIPSELKSPVLSLPVPSMILSNSFTPDDNFLFAPYLSASAGVLFPEFGFYLIN